MTQRIIVHVLFCAFVGAWLSRAAFKVLFDFHGTPLLVAIGTCAVLGGLFGVAAAHDKR